TIGLVTLEERDDTVKLGAYFDGRTDAAHIARDLQAEFTRVGRQSELQGVSVSSIQDQDWMQKWKEGFEPVEIGSRLIVAPSWKLPGAGDRRVVVQIDPGMAFGTGTHQTTRMCLEAIEAHWSGGRLLDVGTGTGILAIAAALLGPGSRIIAIDVDPKAVEVARENAEINGVASSIEIVEGQAREFTNSQFDMVVANLTAEVIIILVGDLAECLAPSGVLILSGILSTLEADVEHAAAIAGLTIIERSRLGEWSAFIARRR
ncbi:MAG TPA: 50S ribosomal protein L11 methyltransferase, partial [Blastocatellia bacterium]|nr:50S ribosomal protein L11 methyltransferase [Blastocatellia bacterium]